MTKISISGIAIGILIGVILMCIVQVCNFASKGKLMAGKKKLVIGAIVIVVTVLISAKLGIYMGNYLKTGDYSDRGCFYTHCGEPSCCKVNLGMGTIQYYCEEHLEEAYRVVDAMMNFTPSEGEKCESCGKHYQEGSDNAKSISRTNMCIKCYNGYKGISDALKEQPLD